MKNYTLYLLLSLSLASAGCVVDVVEQSASREAVASGKKVVSAYIDASIYRDALLVSGSSADTLIADGTFSLWSPGQSTAASIAQNVTMFWTVDTLFRAGLTTYAQGSQRELISIDRMNTTIPEKIYLAVNTSSSNVTVEKMKGDVNVNGTSSDLDITTAGRIILTTQSGKINSSSALGGSTISTSGDINFNVTAQNFESVYAKDSTGNVIIKIPAGVGITFHLYTYGGNIDLFYDKVHQSSISAIDNFTVNGGGKNVTVATGTGDITILNY